MAEGRAAPFSREEARKLKADAQAFTNANEAFQDVQQSWKIVSMAGGWAVGLETVPEERAQDIVAALPEDLPVVIVPRTIPHAQDSTADMPEFVQ